MVTKNTIGNQISCYCLIGKYRFAPNGAGGVDKYVIIFYGGKK